MALYKIFKKDENDFFDTLTNRDFNLIQNLVEGILLAIKNNEKRIDIFEVLFPDGSSLLFSMTYDNYKECLQNCISDFEKNELYEKCTEIRNSIEIL
jgi:hypothetical protein